MYPQLGTTGAWLVGWLLGIVMGGGTGAYLMRRAGMSWRQVALSITHLVVALSAGAKLLYLLEAVSDGSFQENPVHAIVSARLRMPGGFALAVLSSVPLLRWMGLPYLRLADAVIPAAGLLILGTRVGCFLGGCCFGTPSTLPWAVRFPAGSDAYTWQLHHNLIWLDAAASLPVHPLQLYFALIGVALFIGLTAYGPHKRYDGQVLLLFALGYLWSTWLLEHLRATPHGLTQQLVLAAALGATALAMIVERRLSQGLAGRRA